MKEGEKVEGRGGKEEWITKIGQRVREKMMEEGREGREGREKEKRLRGSKETKF